MTRERELVRVCCFPDVRAFSYKDYYVLRVRDETKTASFQRFKYLYGRRGAGAAPESFPKCKTQLSGYFFLIVVWIYIRERADRTISIGNDGVVLLRNRTIPGASPPWLLTSHFQSDLCM